jgi:hypothetical protein
MSEPALAKQSGRGRERSGRPAKKAVESNGTPKQLAVLKRIQRDIDQVREATPELLKQLKL